jgi:hypothetical protein
MIAGAPDGTSEPDYVTIETIKLRFRTVLGDAFVTIV